MKGDVPDYILSEEEILTKIEDKYRLCENKVIISGNIDTGIQESKINEIIENSSEEISGITLWYGKILQ